MSNVIRIVVGEMATNCYLLESNNDIAIIDPGFEPEKIYQKLKELKGLAKYIINTHAHIDHIGANVRLKELTNAKILIHHRDAELLTQPSRNLGFFLGEPIALCKADQLLHEHDIIEIGDEKLEVIHTPGHTKGSICLVTKTFAFTGDTLFIDSIGRTDFPDGSEREILGSLRRLKELLTDNIAIYPGHGELGSFGKAKELNPFLNLE
ncbi:MAG: MBL fold metallo-hydrolase [candidate division WOR-3 bacterium]|nr:MBL fold metallo-hydrolase [candidate division WOR-3 bacterium]